MGGSNSCPRCGGGGWIDAFDKGCKRNAFHAKCECRLCNGSGKVDNPKDWHQCRECKGKGGMGALGPCGETCIHFQRLCGSCEGRGWHLQMPVPTRNHTCPRCNGGGWIDTFDKGCTREDFHAKCKCRLCNGSGKVDNPKDWHQCRECKGKGGMGTLGPCGETCMHFQRLCGSCQGRGWHLQAAAAPITHDGSRSSRSAGRAAPRNRRPSSSSSSSTTGSSNSSSSGSSRHRARHILKNETKAMKKKAKEEKKEKKKREREEKKRNKESWASAYQASGGGPCAPAPNATCPVPLAAPSHQTYQLPAYPAVAETQHGFNESLATSGQAQTVQAMAAQALHSVPAQHGPGLISNGTAPASQPTDDESMLCVVCLQERKNIMVEPCAHLCLCQTCANASEGSMTQCPICRTTIQGFRVIYT